MNNQPLLSWNDGNAMPTLMAFQTQVWFENKSNLITSEFGGDFVWIGFRVWLWHSNRASPVAKSYKASTSGNYDSRLVLTSKLLVSMTIAP